MIPTKDLEPLLVTQPVARRMLGLTETRFHKWKQLGLFDVVQVQGHPMITVESIRRIATPKMAA